KVIIDLMLDGVAVSTTSTGDDGGYRFAGLPAGAYELRADHWEHELAVRAVELTTGQTQTVDFALESTTSITGRLTMTGADEIPVAGVEILLLSKNAPNGKLSVTNEAGEYGFSRIPAGEYSVMLPDGSHRQDVILVEDGQ